MKKAIALAICMFSLSLLFAQNMDKKSHGKTKIGQVKEDGSFTISVGSKVLAEKWAKGLKYGMKEVNAAYFQNFSIVKNEYGVYQLQASNIDGTIKSAIPLVLVKGAFYEKLVKAGNTVCHGISVSCLDCEDACNPAFDTKDKGSCSSGCEACKKSETLITVAFFD